MYKLLALECNAIKHVRDEFSALLGKSAVCLVLLCLVLGKVSSQVAQL